MKVKHLENLFFDPNWKPPEVIYGNDLISEVTEIKEKHAVSTMEIPWELVKDKISTPPEKVVFVENMYLDAMENLEKKIPPIDLVSGIGGGSSHDFAKYVALKRQCRLIQIPTIISADACVTNAIGIRENGRVKYIAHVFIDQIIVDYSILKQAPKELIRYGAGDVLSSHTALYDWKLASKKGLEKFNKSIYEEAKKLLFELNEKRYEIRDVTNTGIKTIIELYLQYARIANQIATDRAQEGSEHFFAYNAEYVTKRHFTHGQLLALGIFIASYLQKNEFEQTAKLMSALGMEYKLKITGIKKDEFIHIMETMREFVEEGGYYYSIFNEVEIIPSKLDELIDLLT